MQISDIMQEVVDELDFHINKPGHPQGLLTKLNQCMSDAVALRKSLLSIEEFVTLDVAVEDNEGAFDLDSLSVEELLNHSKLMRLIHRSGVDVTSRTVFSDAENETARQIVEHFENFSPPLAAFRSSSPAKKEGQFLFHAKGSAPFSLIQVLEAIGAVEFVFAQVFKDETWKPFKREWGLRAKDDQEFRIFYKPVDRGLWHFINGDWMTAFVGDVIRDHLTRNEIDYELFTKVEYKTPLELGSDQSDFDVITLRVGEKAAHCFECKSGVIRENLAVDVIEKGRHIKDVLERHSNEIGSVQLYLVYDHLVNDEQSVLEMFAQTEVVPKRLNQLRELVRDWS